MKINSCFALLTHSGTKLKSYIVKVPNHQKPGVVQDVYKKIGFEMTFFMKPFNATPNVQGLRGKREQDSVQFYNAKVSKLL